MIGCRRLRKTFIIITIHTVNKEEKKVPCKNALGRIIVKEESYEGMVQDFGSLSQFAGVHPICCFSLS
jgi:hypothetical protein